MFKAGMADVDSTCSTHKTRNMCNTFVGCPHGNTALVRLKQQLDNINV
jgi:hypothetical protein